MAPDQLVMDTELVQHALGAYMAAIEAGVNAKWPYMALRSTVRAARENEADRCPEDRGREFALGLVYDAMTWTPPHTARTVKKARALRDALTIALSSTVTTGERLKVRKHLLGAGFNVSPPLKG